MADKQSTNDYATVEPADNGNGTGSEQLRLALGAITWLVVLGLFVHSYLTGNEVTANFAPLIIVAALTLLGVDQLGQLIGGK